MYTLITNNELVKERYGAYGKELNVEYLEDAGCLDVLIKARDAIHGGSRPGDTSDGRQHQTEPKSIQDGDDIRRKGGSGGISGIYYSDGEQHYDLPQVSYGETAARVG